MDLGRFGAEALIVRVLHHLAHEITAQRAAREG